METQGQPQIYYASLPFQDWSFSYFYTDKGLVFTTFQADALDAFDKRFDKAGVPLLQSNTAADQQFSAYFAGRQTKIDLSIDWHFLSLSDFSRQVLKVLQTVTHRISYSELADRVGKAKAVRAVASAVGKNPVEVVIACHRIVRQSGELGQYRDGVIIKRALLELEGQVGQTASRKNY
ncbi:methylated-DNA--[protein]-cysteine S-methyltransferase [Oenococcus kitaharae]|uniref:methylated-DNA--[protein]-cysteine S-methyltransferase n=2 Tax=Oenococcus kitaharae TaxID=336988 RepID=G9WGB3_9LACO|nr:MGMT family protein [Oenococcus kitaharae]EHN59721.1 adaptive response regulator protein [Oenococcus kitaharae DSM 17330]OEY83550.1 hypothetical protein NT95_05430 [Oenococcus kitaharae]OEY85349.1 hypothetical protein NT96_01875 [Oenococcus kitaharae]OEY86201.1 hypothetical protein NV75_01825 [Oenococcus kitaharae]